MRRFGSALILAIVVTGFLLVTALGALSLAYNQLSSLDRVQNAASAGSAAVAGVARLKAKLSAGETTFPEAYNLSRTESATTPAKLANFRPNPRDMTYAIDSVSSVLDLPRCIAVAVISPWTNDARYLYSDYQQQNPALIFHYANIVSDTPLGVIASNTTTNGDDAMASGNKSQPISTAANTGHFYNPYASAGLPSSDPNYWLVKMGGIEDQFLTRKFAGTSSSYYRDLDFVYLPYLPRFKDSGLKDHTTGVVSRQSAASLQTVFQDVIINNNFKVWLDGSVGEDDLARYGLADLFSGDSKYKLSWYQPSLTTDIPDTGPYIASDVSNKTENDQSIIWTRPSKPVKTDYSSPTGFTTEVWRSASTSSFLAPDGDLSRTITAGTAITLPIYGSYQGIRLGRAVTLTAIDKVTKLPINLQSRGSSDQGQLKSVTINSVDLSTNRLSLTFSATVFNSPAKSDGVALRLSDIDALVVDAGIQPSLPLFSGTSVTSALSADGRTVTLSSAVTCTGAAKCPAVGDLINLKKTGQKPVWGLVESVNYSGSTVTGFVLDSFREYPKPLYGMITRANNTTVIFHGGQVSANQYDGGVRSVSDETWLYTPGTNTWTHVASTPGARAGGRLVQLSGATEALVMFGGYRYEAVGDISGTACTDYSILERCLLINQPNRRIAKTFPNDFWRFNVTTNTWTQLSYSAGVAIQPPAASPSAYRALKVLSHFSDRSGLGGNYSANMVLTAAGTGAKNASVSLSAGTIRCFNPATNGGSIAGFSIGDAIKMSGYLSSGGSWEGWGRIVASTNCTSSGIEVAIYGSSGASSVTFADNGLRLEVVDTSYADTKCLWSTVQYCTVSTADLTGMGIGDAVVLEKYNPEGFGTSTTINGQYSGYISNIEWAGGGNWNIYFASSEVVAGLFDFASRLNTSSLLSTPYGRDNPGLTHTGLNIYGGSQLAGSKIAPTAAAILRVTIAVATTWNITAVAALGVTTNLADSPETYSLYSVQLPATATMFTTTSTSGVNGAMVRDLASSRTRSGQPSETVYSWDNGKTWLLEIEPEANSNWNGGKLAVGAEILLEKTIFSTIQGVGGTSAHESFRGTITDIQFPGTTANPGSNYRINVQHLGQNDTGLTVDAANARLTLYYPDLSGSTNGLKVDILTKTSVSQVQGSDLTKLSKLPVGSYVMLIAASQSTANPGTTTKVLTARIGQRNGVVVSGSLNALQLSAAGPFYQNLPLPSSLGATTSPAVSATNALATGTSLTQQNPWRYPNLNWAESWSLSTVNGQWRALLTNTAGNNYIGPPGLSMNNSQVGDKSRYFSVAGLAGVTSGILVNGLYGQSNGNTVNSGWEPTLSSPKNDESLPLLDRQSFVIVGSGTTYTGVAFGGRSPVSPTSSAGVRIGSQSYNNTGVDGSFSLAGTNKSSEDAGYEASLFFDLSYSQTSIIPSVKDSLKLSASSNANMATPSDGSSVCRYLGEASGLGYGCQYASSRLLGTLGRWGVPMGESLAIINPGTSFLYDGSASSSNRSLVMSGPSYSSAATNGRWEQYGYNPYACDSGNGCTSVAQGTLTAANESAGHNTNTVLLAGWAKYTDGGSQTCQASGLSCPEILVTPAGIGQAIVSGPGGPSYCADYTVTSGTYNCDNSKPDARVLSFIPDAEDLIFLFNSAKILSSEGKYKVVGYYGGVKRGYLVAPRATSGEYLVKEIAP